MTYSSSMAGGRGGRECHGQALNEEAPNQDRAVHESDREKGKSLLLGENSETIVEFVDPEASEEKEEEVLFGDGQPNQIIRKSLLTPKGTSEDDWLRS
ncbi:hypothetical protein Droror1_Dr00023917 [Drosera rotundifolia]